MANYIAGNAKITECLCTKTWCKSFADICKLGWSYFGGYCYITSQACATWLTAVSNCSTMGSSLVTVHNQRENVYIQHRHNGDESWIGLNDRSVEGSFVWTNKELSSFRFWARNQPNNWKNEDCVHTLGSWGGYTWNDVPCDNCYNFTCFTGNIHETFKEPAGIHAYAINDVALLTDIFPKLLESWVYPIKIGKKTSILFCKRVGYE